MNLSSSLERHPDLKIFLKSLAGCFPENSGRVYLVGGAVRDLLRGAETINDLDISMTGGEPQACARRIMEAELAMKAEEDKIFGTVKLFALTACGASFTMDLNHARLETYPGHGQLPRIEWIHSLFFDVRRRDFTVNALAMSLDEDSFGELLDYCGGLKDIENRRLRILYRDSFMDDPTRIFRLMRYAAKLDFDIEPETLDSCIRAISKNLLDAVSHDRIFDELSKGLAIENSHRFFDELEIFDVFKGHHFNTDLLKRFEADPTRIAADACPSYDPLLLKILLLDDPLFLGFNLSKRYRQTLSAWIDSKDEWMAAIPGLETDYELRQYLSAIPVEALLCLAFESGEGSSLWQSIERYHANLISKKTLLTGRDLLAMGVEPGNQVGVLLEELLRMKVNGSLEDTLEAEKEYIKKRLERDW